MNWIPARLTWLLIAVAAIVAPGCSPIGALRVGWRQHGILPSPNSGWPEAAAAGALGRRLIGPIWRGGVVVTDVWLGDPAAPPAQDARDVRRAVALVVMTGLLSATIVIAGLSAWRSV